MPILSLLVFMANNISSLLVIESDSTDSEIDVREFMRIFKE